MHRGGAAGRDGAGGNQLTGPARVHDNRGSPMMDVIRWTRTKKPGLEELKALLKTEGLESELYSDRSGTKYGRHKHDFDDFIVIVSGKMKLATDEHEWILKPGDRLDIPMNTFHRAEMMGKEEVRYLSAAK
jgi:mannose-6-phosphate isomerase-like protein (cupin superfamily)